MIYISKKQTRLLFLQKIRSTSILIVQTHDLHTPNNLQKYVFSFPKYGLTYDLHQFWWLFSFSLPCLFYYHFSHFLSLFFSYLFLWLSCPSCSFLLSLISLPCFLSCFQHNKKESKEGDEEKDIREEKQKKERKRKTKKGRKTKKDFGESALFLAFLWRNPCHETRQKHWKTLFFVL